MTEDFEDINKPNMKGIFISSLVIIGLFLFFAFFKTSSDIITRDDSKLTKEDQQGNLWELSVIRSSWREVSLGEPLIARADVNLSGRSLYLDAVVEGNAGEQYMPAAYRNGSLQNAPTFTIYDEKENVLGTGDFAFG